MCAVVRLGYTYKDFCSARSSPAKRTEVVDVSTHAVDGDTSSEKTTRYACKVCMRVRVDMRAHGCACQPKR